MVSYKTAASPNYQLFGFSDSYMDTGSPPTGGLVTTSDLVLALGKSASSATATDSTTCAGLATNGLGTGTSIADAIAQAQTDLVAANDARSKGPAQAAERADRPQRRRCQRELNVSSGPQLT